MGAAGVGLYRTEYLYLTHPDVPDEEEQLRVYRAIIDRQPQTPGDHSHARYWRRQDGPYLGHDHQEANPFMGWRSIRLVVRASHASS